jgi:TfoX/Sxy family transcriptional regulator of competence genes
VTQSLQSEELLGRLRKTFALRPNITEKKMFGGVVFMLNGNMLCGVTQKGQFMVRVGKELEPEGWKLPGAADMDFTGKKMSGMFFVAGDAIEDNDALTKWLDLCAQFVGTLPPK